MASEIKRRFTDTEIQIARKTDLPELLTHLGYQVKRIGRYHTTAEMDSLRIKDRRTWFRYSQHPGGDAITLVQQFCDKTFPEAVEYLLTFNGRARDSPAKAVPSVKRDEVQKPFINAMDMEQGYGDGENPVVLKSEFLLSLCEQLIGAGKLSAKEKSVIDRCTAQVYRDYIRSGYHGAVPTLQDFHAELLRQPEKEAQDVALAIELFTDGSLNTFAKPTNVDTNARILCYDIRDLGKQLLPVGMLVVLDSIFNRIIRNRGLKRNTWIYIDEIYLLFQHEYSANFLFTLW